MKLPKPRDFGLDSDHAPAYGEEFNIPMDPTQPFTQQELHQALDAVVFREALRHRQEQYRHALAEIAYGRASR
jgi:hypothetical protein